MQDNSINNPEYQSLSDKQLAEIDILCDQFESELANGRSPRIESVLDFASKGIQESLLAELITIEFEFRNQRGDKPKPADYLRRFPENEGVIARAFFFGDDEPNRAGDETISDRNDSNSGQSVLLSFDDSPELCRFRLIEELGRGGMGVVWRAQQEAPVKRLVALKLVKSELNSKEVMARFDAEKQALALMDHQNIAKVLDAGTTNDGRPFFVMELVDGIPITEYSDKHKLSIDQRLELFVPVCKAVQQAHQKGIVHRDLKPSNVLIAEVDGEAVPKVIDFGLAKAVRKEVKLTDLTLMTEFGKVVGTVQYMSPEQAALGATKSKDIDTRTDVYSLGVMLYELLTGSTPLDKDLMGRKALLKLLEMVREEDPPRPSNRLSSSSHDANTTIGNLRSLHPARLQQILKGELDWVVMKALEKDRNRRYQSASDFAHDISNYLVGETVAARPPSTWYQVKKFATRNRGLVAAMITIAAALLLGIIGTTYGMRRANQKARLAEIKTEEAQKERSRAVIAEGIATSESKRARDSEAGATFQLAVARFDLDRAQEARSLLHEIPHEYHDSFEWRFCNRYFEGSDVTCYGHSSTVLAVKFTPDGKRVVSVDNGGMLRIWDSVLGEELGTIQAHHGQVLGLAISPDGKLIATGGSDRAIRIWDAESGNLLKTINEDVGAISELAYSPDGKRLVGSYGKDIKIWDPASGKPLLVLSGHEATITGIAYSLMVNR